MDENTIHGIKAAVDAEAFEKLVVLSGACRLRVDVNQKPDGTIEQQRGIIPEPMRVGDRLWITGARGQKIFTRQEGEMICLEWEHLILREVVPIGQWKDAVERDPVHRMDAGDYRGYCVLGQERRTEYVLTGKRMYMFREQEPSSREVVNPATDRKRRPKGPPPIPEEAVRQMALM